jgi:hypothetical protein
MNLNICFYVKNLKTKIIYKFIYFKYTKSCIELKINFFKSLINYLKLKHTE